MRVGIRRRWVMAASLIMPVLAAVSALIAMLVRPRSWERIEPAAILLLASAGVAGMCWLIDVDALESAGTSPSDSLAGPPAGWTGTGCTN